MQRGRFKSERVGITLSVMMALSFKRVTCRQPAIPWMMGGDGRSGCFPVGIEYAIVNGQVVVDQNVQNKTLAGRALRRDRLTT